MEEQYGIFTREETDELLLKNAQFGISAKPQIYFSKPLPRGRREFVPHHHTELEMSYLVSGSGEYTLKDRVYEMNRGDIFLFSNDELHKITYVDGDFVLFNIKFLPRAIREESTDGKAPFYLDLFWNRKTSFSHKIRTSEPGGERYTALLRKIFEETAKPAPGSDILIKQYIIEILVLAARESGYGQNDCSESERLSADALWSVNLAEDYIEKHFTEEISLSELSEKFGMSRNALTSGFKTLNGVSPKNYITSLRLDKAASLLKSTRLSVLDVALECGYNSTASFNKMFLKIIGKTPTEYRKAYEKQ